MKVELTTTTIKNGVKSVAKEILKKDDLRLEMLKNIHESAKSWEILDFYFDYECSHTKKGYRVTKTIKQHIKTKETIIENFIFN